MYVSLRDMFAAAVDDSDIVSGDLVIASELRPSKASLSTTLQPSRSSLRLAAATTPILRPAVSAINLTSLSSDVCVCVHVTYVAYICARGTYFTKSKSVHTLKGLALPRASRSGEIALASSRRLHSTLAVAPVLFTHAVATEIKNK